MVLLFLLFLSDGHEHDGSRSPSHWSESNHTPPVSPVRSASPLRPMSPQPLREEDISSSSKNSRGAYHRKKRILRFSVGGGECGGAVAPSFFPVSVIKSPHEVAPTGSRARYAYEKYAERRAEARASVSPVASHFYDSGSESCSAVSPISYASNDQTECEAPLDFRSRPASHHSPLRLAESLRQVSFPRFNFYRHSEVNRYEMDGLPSYIRSNASAEDELNCLILI